MRRLGAACWAVAMLFAGCGVGSAPEPAPKPTPSASPTPLVVLPLTGTPATDGVPDRPVLVVKVDNTQHGRPQVGLSQADLVVEELVEGGLTRLAVMFHSALPEVVVPVRSIRTTDVGIVAPTGGALVASGGAGRVLRIVDQAGITVVAEGDPGLSREASRSAPYNVVLDPAAALNGLTGQAPPAVPYLAWAPSGATPPAGTVASSVTVMFSAAHSTRWEWADGVWRRLDELAAEGDEFRPANVLVLRVTTRDAGYQDPAGNPVPETVLEGSGAATLLTGGRAVESRWSKASPAQPFELSDASGASLAVPPGRTWIELVPEAGSVDTG